MKTFTTGQVARICGLKNSRAVAKLFDEDKIQGEVADSRFQRRTTRRIPLTSLLAFMRENSIPLDGLSDDFEVQEWMLHQQTIELKKIVERESKRSGVLYGFKGLPDAILAVVKNLDPLDNLDGISEDRRRLAVFKKLSEVMKRHIALRGAKAIAKKQGNGALKRRR